MNIKKHLGQEKTFNLYLFIFVQFNQLSVHFTIISSNKLQSIQIYLFLQASKCSETLSLKSSCSLIKFNLFIHIHLGEIKGISMKILSCKFYWLTSISCCVAALFKH